MVIVYGHCSTNAVTEGPQWRRERSWGYKAYIRDGGDRISKIVNFRPHICRDIKTEWWGREWLGKEITIWIINSRVTKHPLWVVQTLVAISGQGDLLHTKLKGNSSPEQLEPQSNTCSLGWGRRVSGLCISTQTVQVQNVWSVLLSKGETLDLWLESKSQKDLWGKDSWQGKASQ